jgi:uncharacterized protein
MRRLSALTARQRNPTLHASEVPVTTTPTSQLPVTERLPVLDIVRGFALLGILIMNMPSFSWSAFAGADGSRVWPGPIDQWAEHLRDALFSGKFNSMFSLLFGIGFTIQYQRMRQQDPLHADGLYMRRLLVLAAFGLVHGFVFWFGDILHSYALLGLLLLFALRRLSDRALMVLMAVLLLYPAVSGLLRVLVMTPDMVAERVAIALGFVATNNVAFGHGSFFDAAIENTRMMLHFYGTQLTLWSTFGFYVEIALTMVLGVLAGRRRWAHRIPELMPTIRFLTWWALGLGLACAVAYTVIFELNRAPGPSLIKVLGGVCYSLSRVSTMVFYVLVIVRLCQHPMWLRRLAPMAAAGRMPLTNYLMQTAICITLFEGWGLGWWGRVGPAAGLALALAVFFCIQIPLSLWWLRRHERGPLEAWWAHLTYGTRGRRAALPPRAADGA